MEWKNIAVFLLIVTILFYSIWIIIMLKKEYRKGVLFGRETKYYIRTGSGLQKIIILTMRGKCKVSIRNTYANTFRREIYNTNKKTVLILVRKQYLTVKVEEGDDFIVEVCHLHPRYF